MATAVVELGQPIDYAIEIVNTGNQPAVSAVLTDVLPAGTTLITGSLTCSSGTCWYDAGDRAVYWNGDVARAIADNAVLMDNIFAWLLEAGVDVPWLSQTPISGTVLPAQCVTVEVTLDATGLPIADYAAELVVWNNDPDTPAVHLPVAMHVTCAMRIYLPVILRNYP